MLSKLTALALLSSVEAVLPSCTGGQGQPITCTNFPVYATASTGSPNATPFGNQPYACVRNNFAYVWPVNKDASTNVAVVTPASGAGSSIKMFYGTSVAALGTVAASTDTATTAAQNSGCCASAEAGCLVSGADGNAQYTGIVTTRITKATTGSDSAYSYTAIQNDFLLAATYQKSVASFGAAKSAADGWCDPMVWTLTTATATQDLVSGAGLSGLTKCTYILHAPANTGAPGFVLKGISDALPFDLHFAEWKTGDVAFIPVASTGPNFYGTYNKDTYPDPLMTAALWKSSFSSYQPKMSWPGSMGLAFFSKNVTGDISDQPAPGLRTLGVDSGQLVDDWQNQKKAFDNYQTNVLNPYNNAVGAYNKAVQDEKDRVADIFKALFNGPVPIPSRPCPPTLQLPVVQQKLWFNASSISTPQQQVDFFNAQLQYNAGSLVNQQPGASMTNSGFIDAYPASGATYPLSPQYVGHTFGLLGQGAATMPGTNNAFWVGPTASATATNAGGMMISVFPNVAASAAYSGAQNITITAKTVAWNTGVFPLNAPVPPPAPIMPVAAMNARYIAAGVAAATAVAMTLF